MLLGLRRLRSGAMLTRAINEHLLLGTPRQTELGASTTAWSMPGTNYANVCFVRPLNCALGMCSRCGGPCPCSGLRKVVMDLSLSGPYNRAESKALHCKVFLVYIHLSKGCRGGEDCHRRWNCAALKTAGAKQCAPLQGFPCMCSSKGCCGGG